MTTLRQGLEVRLASRPHGEPSPDNFEIAQVELGDIGDGEVLVRNVFMSVDPYMRGRMNDRRSYVPPFELGRVMQGGAVGEVVDSRSDALGVGDVVVHNFGWRSLAVGPAKAFRIVDAAAAPLSHYLGILGMTGLTAYAGLVAVAAFKAPDAVFVSGAAGAVGSAVGQMARLLGSSRVIGSAGSDEKVALLVDELGFDAAFNYRNGLVSTLLAGAAPDGIDVYFDNVGGDHLEAAINSLRDFGRIAACGSVSSYNATEPVPGPSNLAFIVGKRLSLRGFIIGDHLDLRPEFTASVSRWIRAGDLHVSETIVDGLENAPDAFIGMLRGENVGKMIVRVGEMP
ncbi:MAG: NADP-dependent oxidoreductase [Acidimicrobiales bacterium]